MIVKSHAFSQDLLQIPNGALAQHLKQVITFARNHVYSCRLCLQKGFYCEVCDNPKIIYPFDTENTFRVSLVLDLGKRVNKKEYN